MPTTEKKLAHIIPAVKLPRDLTQFFSYEIPEDLREKIQIGDAVIVPWRKKEILGIVRAFPEKIEGDFKLKEIKAIVEEFGLSFEQMQLAEYVSRRYYTPVSLIISLMIPEAIKKESRKDISINSHPEIPQMKDLPEEKVLNALANESRILLIHSLESERHELYKNTIKQEAPDSQILLMLPEYFDIWNFAGFYIGAFGRDKVAVLCSNITKNQYFKEWQKIKTGTAKIIISTRQGVFAPFQKLSLVIVDDEHNSSYKQWDQNPRYHGVAIAIALAKIHQAKILLSSPVPSLESWHRAKSDFATLDVSQKPKTIPGIVNFEDERKTGNYSFIPEKLQQALLEKIYGKKQALILIPRLGEKTMHQCRDCGYIAQCEVCENTLIGYKNKLYCSRCKRIYEPLARCPKCNGQNIGTFGGGSRRVFEELEKLFENKNINIVELDSISAEDKNSHKVFKDFQNGKIDILVGTQMIWKNWNMPNLDLVGIIFPEIIFNMPGFRSKERAWQFLDKAYRLAQDKTVIIGTYKPEHKYFEEIKNKQVADFLDEELANRSASLSPIPYPPLGKLIKLIYKNQDPRACEKEAKWQEKILQRTLSELNLRDKMEIMHPFPAQNYREYGKYRWHIILKYTPDLSLEKRDQVLSAIKNVWIIDIDPDEIL